MVAAATLCLIGSSKLIRIQNVGILLRRVVDPLEGIFGVALVVLPGVGHVHRGWLRQVVRRGAERLQWRLHRPSVYGAGAPV